VSEYILGVLADTHGRMHPAVVPTFVEHGVAKILHAGDIGRVTVLDTLGVIAPVIAVRGNVDHGEWAAALPLVADLVAAGNRLIMTHIGGRPERPAPEVARLLAEARPALFICGHSHQPRSAPMDGGGLWLNPGAAGRQGFHRRATVAIVRLVPGTVQAELLDLGPR